MRYVRLGRYNSKCGEDAASTMWPYVRLRVIGHGSWEVYPRGIPTAEGRTGALRVGGVM